MDQCIVYVDLESNLFLVIFPLRSVISSKYIFSERITNLYYLTVLMGVFIFLGGVLVHLKYADQMLVYNDFLCSTPDALFNNLTNNQCIEKICLISYS
jgi:hypothetical protein